MSSPTYRLVETDTIFLIATANNIVSSCTGTNCSTSYVTRTSIKQQLSKLAQQQAYINIRLLGIEENSVIARNIYDGYLNLGSAVESVYNYQCGNSDTGNCVENSNIVKKYQDELVRILISPVYIQTKRLIITSFLLILFLLAILMSFIFITIGSISKIATII